MTTEQLESNLWATAYSYQKKASEALSSSHINRTKARHVRSVNDQSYLEQRKYELIAAEQDGIALAYRNAADELVAILKKLSPTS